MLKRLSIAVFAFAISCISASASTCYVSEFTQAGASGVQVARQPGTDQSPITVSASSAQSAAFASTTVLIRVNCDVVVSFLIGTNPTATTSNARMAAGQTEYFQVIARQLIAFISNN